MRARNEVRSCITSRPGHGRAHGLIEPLTIAPKITAASATLAYRVRSAESNCPLPARVTTFAMLSGRLPSARRRAHARDSLVSWFDGQIRPCPILAKQVKHLMSQP